MNKLYKPQHFIIGCGTYPMDVLCIVNMDNDQTKRVLSKYYAKDDIEKSSILGTTLARTAQKDGKFIVRFKTLYFYSHGVIAHEMFHVTEMLFDYIGIEYDINKSSEAYAYLLQHLVHEFYKQLK